MRVLLIKMSSLGDVFHTFPALTDAQEALPNLKIDWVVEKGFSEIASWHPLIDKVYPIELRSWRKTLYKKETRAQIKAFFEEVNQTRYDVILDAQGLLKSAWVGRRILGDVSGFDFKSARDPLASIFYQNKFSVGKDQRSILRLRQLFALALNYPLPESKAVTYGVDTSSWTKPEALIDRVGASEYVVFLHGTTWDTKYWPEEYWIELLKKVVSKGLKVVLFWGNEEERLRAFRITSYTDNANVWVPQTRLSLKSVSQILNFAKGVVSVDTGLSHVAASLEVPMVVIYRVTDPKLVGTDSPKVIQLTSPCSTMYLKKFTKPHQEKQSLEGLSVDDIYSALFKE